MELTHLRNTIQYIERTTKRQLEDNMTSERSLKMRLAELLTTKEELVAMSSPGVPLVEQSILEVEAQLNQNFEVPQAELAKALNQEPAYVAMQAELARRNQVTQGQPEKMDVEPFLESKMQAVVKDIEPRPEGIPMVVHIKTFKNKAEKVKVGDYICNCNRAEFQITYLVKRTSETDNKGSLEVTLNARTQHEKEVVMKALGIGEQVELY